MKHVFILLVLLLLVITGCSHPTTDTAGTEQRIVIDPSTRKETLPVWLWYAGTRAYWMKKTFFERFPGTTVYRHTPDEEVAARDGCAHLWRELKSEDGRVDRYLDDLLAIQQSGFIREYVWFYFREPEGASLPTLGYRILISGKTYTLRAIRQKQKSMHIL